MKINTSFHGLKELSDLHYYDKSLRAVPENRRYNSLNFIQKVTIKAKKENVLVYFIIKKIINFQRLRIPEGMY